MINTVYDVVVVVEIDGGSILFYLPLPTPLLKETSLFTMLKGAGIDKKRLDWKYLF